MVTSMHNIVPLGSGVFAFVKYINRGFVMPVFNFLDSKIVSYGIGDRFAYHFYPASDFSTYLSKLPEWCKNEIIKA